MTVVPLWFRLGLLALLTLILIGVVLADIASKDYEAQATALALIGVIGAGIAADQLKKGKGDE